MGSLARNTYYNISAFGINTILSLVAVTVLVRGYGLDGYGLIILARLLLPSGMLGLLEAGFPEVTARTVAAARAVGGLGPVARRGSAARPLGGGVRPAGAGQQVQEGAVQPPLLAP